MGSTRPPPSLATHAFGIVRAQDASAATRRALLTELCEILTESLGAIFVAHVAPGYRQLASAIETGQCSFAWMPPLLVLELEQRGAAIPLALPLRRGSTASFYSALIVKQGGPKSMMELSGKRAIWVERESVAGHIIARIHLGLSGFNLQSLASETFAHSHDGVIDALMTGRADVGATFCTLDPRTNRIVHGGWTNPDGTSSKPIEVIATAGPIPNDAIVAGSRVPRDMREKFTQWLFAGESRRARDIFATLLRSDGFTRSMTSHYDPLRAMLADGRARGLFR